MPLMIGDKPVSAAYLGSSAVTIALGDAPIQDGGGHPAPTQLQIIGNNTGVSNNAGVVGGTVLYRNARQRHTNGKVGARSIRFVDQLIRIGVGSGTETNSPGAALTYECAIETASTFERLLRGGANSALLQPGSTNLTDPSNLRIEADQDFWSRYLNTLTSTSNGFTTTGNVYPDQQGFTIATPRSVAGTGAFNSSGTVASAPYTPTAILGIPDSPVASMIVAGDSIANNQADTNTGTTGGFINRALLNVGGHVFNWARQTVGGNSMSAQQSPSLVQKVLWQYATDFLPALGSNDLAASSSVTLQQLQDGFAVLANYARSVIGPYGLRLRVHACSIIPRETAQWVSDGREVTRVAYNAWLAAGADGLCDKYHDTSSAVVTAPSTWPSNDQTHPPPAEHANMAAVLAANLVPFQDPYYLPAAA